MKNRIYFLDNLRTFLIFLVILYHAQFVYTSGLHTSWIVVDPIKNESLGLIGMYIDLFVMFALFFISGYFIPGSIKNIDFLNFLKAKFQRLMVPWIIAILTLIPAYKWIFLYSRGLPQEEWFTYFHWFQRAGSDLYFFANNPAQNWLWFLPVLFLFQLLYLALYKLDLLSFKLSLKNAGILTFIAGLVYSFSISAIGLKGWFDSFFLHFQRERFVVYFLVFLLGALCYRLKVFEIGTKNKKYYIISNVVLTISLGVYTVFALNLFFNLVDPGRNYYFISGQMDRLVYYASVILSMMNFLYILIHVFRFNFNITNILLSRLNSYSYYVYIIHMIVLGLVALLLVQLSLPVFVKYLTLTILTFIISNGIVHVYRRLLTKNTYIKVTTATVLAIAIISTVYAHTNEDLANNNNLPGVSQTEVIAQDIGLHEAVIQGNMEVIKQHIRAGSNLDEREPSGGSSPLITAAVFGKTEFAKALIEAGADVNFRNNEGSTALITAAFFCRKEIVEALLANGADKSIKNNAGSTAWDSVAGPFESVQGIYDYFGTALAPLGLQIDQEYIESTRPVIAEILNN